MSMELLTIIQTITVFTLYFLMTCVLPFRLLNRRLQGFRLTVRVMFSFVFGNFYLINLVFVLQLLHLSNRWTLMIGVIVPFIIALSKLEGFSGLHYVKRVFDTIRKIAEKQLGLKSLAVNLFRWIRNGISSLLLKCFRVVKRNPIDVVLFLAFTVVLVIMYGTNLTHTFGYCTSDMPVHNYWVNYMSRGELFVAGVYPFGFHCVLYFLHAVFGLPTYVLLRVFCFVQTMFIHWMLLLVLKSCFKSRYLAYAAAGFYLGAGIFSGNTYLRFFNTLPQEYGMIFILPSVFFGFAFFENKKKELEQLKSIQVKESNEPDKKRKLSTYCLMGFAMSFGLTLVGHFYDTIIAGIFCVAMAIAFAFRFFRKEYFGKVILTCFISVFIAVLPMAIAFATGTPLEGSLNWALGVISESSEETTSTVINHTKEEVDNDTNFAIEEESDYISEDAVDNTVVGEIVQSQTQEKVKNDTIIELIRKACSTIDYVVRSYVFTVHNFTIRYSLYVCGVLLFLFATVFFICKNNDYAAQMLTVALFFGLMCVLIASSKLGLPQLMDSTRASIYFAYTLPFVWGFAVDAILVLFFGWLKRPWVLNFCSLVVVGAVVGLIIQQDIVRKPRVIDALEKNEAITCLTNIIHENKDWTWTICSANDELRMLEDYGYHYEPINLLRGMELAGDNAQITIPTKYIYFFIEKVPLDYYGTYENSGQTVSEEGANRALPLGSGLQIYYTENRWIIMSRMYYWAKAFQNLYPNEMKVYYETDEFICYRLEQNTDNLFDLGIDYGFNMKMENVQ